MKILVVDDHALVRRGLHHVVKEGFPDAEVVEAESAAAALEHVHKGTEVDLALVDVRMPDLDGLELLRAIKTDKPDMPVIMLSTYDNAPYVKRALAEGDPEPVRRPRGLGPRSQRAPGRVQPDAARARHPGAALRGQGEPRDRAAPLSVGEDRQGS